MPARAVRVSYLGMGVGKQGQLGLNIWKAVAIPNYLNFPGFDNSRDFFLNQGFFPAGGFFGILIFMGQLLFPEGDIRHQKGKIPPGGKFKKSS